MPASRRNLAEPYAAGLVTPVPYTISTLLHKNTPARNLAQGSRRGYTFMNLHIRAVSHSGALSSPGSVVAADSAAHARTAQAAEKLTAGPELRRPSRCSRSSRSLPARYRRCAARRPARRTPQPRSRRLRWAYQSYTAASSRRTGCRRSG